MYHCSFLKKCLWGSGVEWSSFPRKKFLPCVWKADRLALEDLSSNRGTFLKMHPHWVALAWPLACSLCQWSFSSRVDEYRIPIAGYCCQALLKSWRFYMHLSFSGRSVTCWQERGSIVQLGSPSLPYPNAYYSNPHRCCEGVLTLIWKRNPLLEQINTWAVCLHCLPSFCTVRLFCREDRSMALIFSSLQ